MKSHAIQKSSFTLPADEIPLVARLRKQLKLKSNTEVIRQALKYLAERLERRRLREQYENASNLVRKANAADYLELDALAAEGLE